jgi:serine/threonine protein kinase
MATGCPSGEELVRIGGGSFAGSCPAAIAEHIEACADCRAFLERCLREDLGMAPSLAAERPGVATLPRIEGFAIESELGRGAMGVVYRARCETLGRRVALKFLPGGCQAGPRERKRWLHEAKTASQVRHPGVVVLHEVVETDRFFVLVLEFIAGGTLADRLNSPLAPRNAARWMEMIARAVQYIHECGQLHLDLKPSNILLDGETGSDWEDVIPKVTDFGIARPAESGGSATGAAEPGGTPSYMAPEQITQARKDMTAGADIHGLGAILYHMLTGRPPYQGATVLETIDLLQKHDPLPPRRLNPKIPADLETICLKCLEKDPARRYGSAKLVADDLGRWQAGRAISARPVSVFEKGWRWCRRRPVVAALVSLLAITLSVAFIGIATLWRRAEAARLRAEEQFRLSSEVVTDLLDVTVGPDGTLPTPPTLEHAIPVLEKDRQRLLALSASQPGNATLKFQLACVDGCLGINLAQAGRPEEAKSFLLESHATLDALARQSPGDKRIRDLHTRHLRNLAEVTESTHNPGESARYLRQAVQLSEVGMREGLDVRAALQLVDSQGALAWLLYRQGRREEATALFAANRRVLGSLPPVFNRERLPVEWLNSDVETALCAEMPARENEGLTRDRAEAIPGLRSPADAAQSPDEWAGLAMEALRHGDAAHVPHAAMGFACHLAEITATFRRLGEVDRARRINDRILALAARLVREYPDAPGSYLVRSIAYVQLYKKAYQADDLVAVEANMKLALAAAEQALVLDNSSGYAHQLADSLRRHLAALKAKE